MTTVIVSPTSSPAVAPSAPSANARDGRRRTISSRIYLPALSIVAIAIVLLAIGASSHWGGTSFAASMTNQRVVVVGPLTIGILLLFLVVERLRPAQRRPFFARGYRQDVLYTVLNATLVVPHSEFAPRWLVIALIFVAMDACNWTAHLANHKVRMLWRFHELHHSQEDMNALTVFRTHPLIHVSYLLALIPGVVLLANGELSALL